MWISPPMAEVVSKNMQSQKTTACGLSGQCGDKRGTHLKELQGMMWFWQVLINIHFIVCNYIKILELDSGKHIIF